MVLFGSSREDRLVAAAENGNVFEVRRLVEKGTNVNCTDSGGFTPLHRACMKGHLDVVKYLIEKGANAKAKSDIGSTPVHNAYIHGHLEVVNYLVGNDEETSLDERQLVVSNKKPCSTKPLPKKENPFATELWKEEDEHVVFKLKALVPLISNVHEMKLFYTFVRFQGRLGELSRKEQNKYIRRGLEHTAKTTNHTKATAIFKIILDYALDDGAINATQYYQLGDEAVLTHTENAAFILDIRQELAYLRNQIIQVENRAHRQEEQTKRIVDYLRETQLAIKRQNGMKSAISMMRGLLEAVSLGIVGSLLEGAVGASYEFCVDFLNLDHLSNTMETCGTALENEALGNALQVLSEVPAYLATEDAAESFAEGFSEEVVNFIAMRFEEIRETKDGSEASIQALVLLGKFSETIGEKAPDVEKATSDTNSEHMRKPPSISERIARCEMECAISYEGNGPGTAVRLAALEEDLLGEPQKGKIVHRLESIESELNLSLSAFKNDGEGKKKSFETAQDDDESSNDSLSC